MENLERSFTYFFMEYVEFYCLMRINKTIPKEEEEEEENSSVESQSWSGSVTPDSNSALSKSNPKFDK